MSLRQRALFATRLKSRLLYTVAALVVRRLLGHLYLYVLIAHRWKVDIGHGHPIRCVQPFFVAVVWRLHFAHLNKRFLLFFQ